MRLSVDIVDIVRPFAVGPFGPDVVERMMALRPSGPTRFQRLAEMDPHRAIALLAACKKPEGWRELAAVMLPPGSEPSRDLFAALRWSHRVLAGQV